MSPETRFPGWEALEDGAPIAELIVVPDPAQLFMFSAATWNRHRIHFSRDAALAEGHADVVIHRALLGNYLARMLEAWFGDAGRVARLEWKVVRSAVPNEPLHCRGEVTGLDRDSAEPGSAHCQLRIVAAPDRIVAEGAALVLANSR